MSGSYSRSQLVQGSGSDFSQQPASLPAIPTSTPTASTPKAVLAPSLLTPLEKVSQHTWGAGGDAVHFPHGFGSAIA